MRHVFALALALAALSPCRAATVREPSIYPALDKDQRLRQSVTLAHPMRNLGDVAAALSEKTGAQIAVEGDYLTRPVVISLKNREAREIMTDIGLVARGTWICRRGAYLLLENAQEAQIVQNFGGMAKARDGIDRLGSTLSGPQIELLRAGRPLAMSQLTGIQQHWVATAVALSYWKDPDRYPRSVLMGYHGVELRLIPSVRGEAPSLFLCVPRATRTGPTSPLPLISVPLR